MSRVAFSALTLSALGLPLLTWLPVGPVTSLHTLSFYQTPLWGITILALAVVALWCAPDPWLAAFGVFACLRASDLVSLGAASALVLGLVLAGAFAQVPLTWLRAGLVTLGLVEVALLALQGLGVWVPLGEWTVQTQIPHGTFGNPKYLGLVLAMIVPLAPLWTLPALGLGLILSKSGAAVIAAAVALMVRFRGRWWVYVAASVVGLGVVWARGWSLDGIATRWTAWKLAAFDLNGTWLFGHGLGSWATRFAEAQHYYLGGDVVFFVGHNEYLQLVYETGLVGLVFLAGWLWSQRARFLAEPSLLALAIVCLWFSPWHLASTAVVALAVVGGAGRNE